MEAWPAAPAVGSGSGVGQPVSPGLARLFHGTDGDVQRLLELAPEGISSGVGRPPRKEDVGTERTVR